MTKRIVDDKGNRQVKGMNGYLVGKKISFVLNMLSLNFQGNPQWSWREVIARQADGGLGMERSLALALGSPVV